MAFVKFIFGDKEISFNKAWVATKSFEEFKAHEKHHELTDAQYKEVYDACKKQPDAKPQAPAPAKEAVKQ